MLPVALLLAGTLSDQSGCVDPEALSRELSARAPQAVVDVEVSASADSRTVRIVIANLTPPVERDLSVQRSECKELPRAIATIAAAAFEHRDVLDGPELVVPDAPPTALPPPERDRRPPPSAHPDTLEVAPVATAGVSAAARDPLLVDVSLGGGARIAQGVLVGRIQGCVRQTMPIGLDATSATLTSLVFAPDVGVAFATFGSALVPRAGVELGGAAAARLDGKRVTFVPRADLHVGVDLEVGPGQVGVGLRVPFLPVVFVQGKTRVQEPVAWLGLRAGWTF